MTIYVDSLFQCGPTAKWPYTHSCHMISDSGEPELDQAAQKLGLKPSYRQYDRDRFPHYDLTPSKRAQALKNGAVALHAFDFTDKIAEIKLDQWLEAQAQTLGEEVRNAWIGCQATKENPKPEHLLPYGGLDPWNKWVDDEIGKQVARYAILTYIRRMIKT